MFRWLSGLFGGKPRSGQWPRVRREHLRRFPTCAACGRSKDIEVHHVVPFSVAPDRELEPSNLLSLCADPCHLVFGHLLNFRSHNPTVRTDAAVYLDKVRNRP